MTTEDMKKEIATLESIKSVMEKELDRLETKWDKARDERNQLELADKMYTDEWDVLDIEVTRAGNNYESIAIKIDNLNTEIDLIEELISLRNERCEA